MKKFIVCAELIFSLFLGFVLPTTVFAQNILSGQVSNEKTGEKIQGAVITVENSYASVVTDANGNFKIANLKTGQAKIRISHISYEPLETLWTSSEPILNIKLKERIILANEINIMATRAGDHSAMAYTTLTKEELEKQVGGKNENFLAMKVNIASDQEVKEGGVVALAEDKFAGAEGDLAGHGGETGDVVGPESAGEGMGQKDGVRQPHITQASNCNLHQVNPSVHSFSFDQCPTHQCGRRLLAIGWLALASSSRRD